MSKKNDLLGSSGLKTVHSDPRLQNRGVLNHFQNISDDFCETESQLLKSIEILAYLTKAVFGHQLGEIANELEIDYYYDAAENNHVFQFYPSNIENRKINVDTKIKEVLFKLEPFMDEMDGEIRPLTRTIFFDTKMGLLVTLGKYYASINAAPLNISEFDPIPTKLDVFKGFTIGRDGYNVEFSRNLLKGLKEKIKRDPDFDKQTLS